MEITESKIKGCFLIKNSTFSDNRGWFYTPYIKEKFEQAIGEEVNWIQDNQSYSKKGVIRGIHFQREPYAQSKLVRCSYGLVKDVVVDLRPDSPTYGKWVAFKLSGKNGHSVYVPKGCGHGFSVLSKEAVLDYKVDNYWNKESEGGILYNDKTLDIDWEVDIPIVSDKDKKLGALSSVG